MLHKPKHDRMSDGDPGPDAGLQGEQQGAKHTLELLDPALHRAIALGLANRSVLRY